jgi:hypothetical protein
MALLHKAELRPTKLELLAEWLPNHPWYAGPATGEIVRVAGCRFDDPAGAVGVETILVRVGDGPIHHTPLTYRGEPLPGGERWLIGTAEHSVLGQRWVYDACGDPVYGQELARAILTGSGQAEEFLDDGGELRRREPAMVVSGSGAPGADVPAVTAIQHVVDNDPTLIIAGPVGLAVVRVVRPEEAGVAGGTAEQNPALAGTWDGQATPVPLAYVLR